MNDIRENILDRIYNIWSGITGIAAVGRNVLDVPGLTRPAILQFDGAEDLLLGRPNSYKNFAQVQLMELKPEIRLLLRADSGNSAGTLASTFRARILTAIASDVTLQGILGANGAIRYEGCSMAEPSPETKEPRMEFTFVFSYPLKLSDLT